MQSRVCGGNLKRQGLNTFDKGVHVDFICKNGKHESIDIEYIFDLPMVFPIHSIIVPS
jgi:hypothetical protein